MIRFLFRNLWRGAGRVALSRSARRSPRAGGWSWGFRPRLEALEERAVPSAGPATHFQVFAPRVATAGRPAEIEVVALDASNHVVPNYTGTVQLTDTDTATTLGGTALPATYTFTGRDHGAHEFTLTPGASGSDTVTATDTTTASIAGSATFQVNPAPVATHFLVVAGSTDPWSQGPYAGQATNVRVIAMDASNHIVPTYTGTVQLTDTDSTTTVGGAALPTTYTFTTADRGVHTFSVTPGAVGTETVAVTDTANSALTGSDTLQVSAAPVATHFLVVVPPNAAAGKPSPVLVEALDASNHPVTNYTGTVQLTSTDTAATSGGTALPATYTFSAADHGEHVFLVNFATTGNATVTATDMANALSGTATTTVGTATPHPYFPFGGRFEWFGHF